MAVQGDIGLRVRAIGLQEDIARQANAAQRTLNRTRINLSLDDRSFRQPLGRITGDMSEFQKSLDASTARVFAFGATVSIINGIADGFRATVDAVIQVEKALADINVVMGLSAEGLQSFSDRLFEVAKNTSQTFETVANAAVELARQGLGAEETLRRVNDALILTRLSGLESARAVEALTAVVNGFSKAGLNTSDIINRLANVDAAFAVSSKDLADALARSGATAQDAGVSFNELLAVITSVQQQTARGGAVIGNAFKSIFTRLQRSGVREALEEIGVATTDSFGNFRSAIDILKDYAKVYYTLADAQQAYTAEQIAGVYQINNLRALISDLNKEFSIYGQALSQAANTTDEAVRRNEELNKTFAAMAVQAGQSLTQLAQAFGELSLEPAMEKVLGIIQTVVDSMNSMLGEGDGDSLMSKFFKGMGHFISGPGLALVSAAFGKLFMVVVKHGMEALKEMFKISSEAQRQKALQESILNILMKDEQAYRKITSAAGDQNRQAQILLGIIRQINSEYATQQQLISSLARSPALRGITPGRQGFTGVRPQTGTSAGGFNPEQKKTFAEGAIPEIEASVNAGYVNTVQPQQVRQMNIPQVGNIMYNTQERVVKMPNVAQPFIVPPTSSKAYPGYANTVKENFGEKMGNMVLGRAFTPAQRSFAEDLNPTAKYNSIIEKQSAKGLVPNYAARMIGSRKDFDDLGLGIGSSMSFERSVDKDYQEFIKANNLNQPRTSKEMSIVEGGNSIRLNQDIAKILKSGGKNPDLQWDGSNFKSGYKYEFDYGGKTIIATGKEFKELFSKSESGKYSMRKESGLAKVAHDPSVPQVHKINEDVSMLVPLPMGNAATQENVIISGQELLKTISLTEVGKLGLVPKGENAKETAAKLKNNLINDTFQVGFKTSGIQEFDDNVTLRDAIDRDMSNAISGIIKNNANKVLGSKSSTFKLNTADIDARAKSLVQQNSSLAGFLFEEVITSAINKSSAFDEKDQYRRWDFNAGDKPALNEIFDRAVGELSDAKRTPSPLAKVSIGKKSLFATPQGNRILRKAVNSANGFSPDPVSFGGEKQLNKNIKNAAEGLVPNFAGRSNGFTRYINYNKYKGRESVRASTLTSAQRGENAYNDFIKTGRISDVMNIPHVVAHAVKRTGGGWSALKKDSESLRRLKEFDSKNPGYLTFSEITEGNLQNKENYLMVRAEGEKMKAARNLHNEKIMGRDRYIKLTASGKPYVGPEGLKYIEKFYPEVSARQWDKNPNMYFLSGYNQAAGGLVPNFANYIFDADVVGAKNSAAMQKAILASPVKKNLMFGPSGSGKTSVAGRSGGIFLRTAEDIARINPLIDEITMLSGAAKTKAGGLSKPAQALLDAANSSGGRISYVYVPNDEIISRRNKRVESPFELDTRGKKQLKGTRYAPRNQFDFIQQIKNSSRRFSLIKNFAEGLVPNFANLLDNQKAFASIGLKRPRAVALDVDDTLMHTGKSVEKMGLSGRDKYKAYNDPEISKQIAKTAPLTPLGKRIQNLKNKDDVFILTAASPYRNSILAERFGIPENKILSLQDPKIIKQFGLDQKKPSKRGISRQEKDPSYQLGTKADDFRTLNTGEQKRKILDSFVKNGIRPTLYDDSLGVLKEAGEYGRRVQYAAEGLVPNFVVGNIKSISASNNSSADLIAALNNGKMVSAWPRGETRRVKEIENNEGLLNNRTISEIYKTLIAKQYNPKALKYGSYEGYERVYKALSPEAKKLLAKPLGKEGDIGLFESFHGTHKLLNDQFVPEVAKRMRKVLEGENIRSGGLTGSGGEWGDLRYGNIMVKKGALEDPKVDEIWKNAVANGKKPVEEVVKYLWGKDVFKIVDASLLVNKGIHPELQFLEGGKARARKEHISDIQASHPGIEFSKKGYGKEGDFHYVNTKFNKESEKVLREILEERRALQDRLIWTGLVPNFVGRGGIKETSSRIYESVLATNSYGMNVPFEDTRVENIEINGQKQPVAVNSREKIFKTGKDVQRHFGLDSRPSGGMVLAPQNTAAGKENRKEFASKVENAAEGIVPNFAGSAYDLMLEKNPDEEIDLRAIQKSLDKKQDGPLYLLKNSGKINLKASVSSLQQFIERFGAKVKVSDSKLEKWIESDKNNNIRDFSTLAKAHEAYKAIATGAPTKSFKESQQEYEEENRKKHVEKNIIAAYPHKGSPRPQRGYLKEPDGDRWQVDFLGTGIKKESLNNENANLKSIINNEFSVALENVSKQFKFSGALAQLGAEAGALRTKLKNNIESTQISTITGNVFDIVIKTLAQGGRKFNDQGGKTNDRIDIRNITPALNQILDIPESGATMVELKNSPNQETLNNVAYKILKEKNLYKSDKKASEFKRKGLKRIGRGSDSPLTVGGGVAPGLSGNAFKKVSEKFAGSVPIGSFASGYVPNFVDFSDKRFKLNELPNLPQGLQKGVSDAVQREKDAGVPASQIRVDFPSSGGIVSNFAKTPPVAITNTRDEGNFASANKSVARGIQNRQNGIRWAKASGLDMDPLTGKIAAQGLIPNFVTLKDIRTTSASIKTVQQEISDSLDRGDNVENQKLLDRKKQLVKELDNQLSIAKKSRTINDNTLKIEEGILSAHKKELKVLGKQSNKQFQRGLRAPGLQNAAFAAPMVLSMAQGFIPEKEGGTTAGVVSGAASGAAAAGSIASLALGMGPWGVVAAGVVTAIGAIDGALRKMKPSAEELSAVYKKELSENTQNINSAKQYVQAQQSLNEALDSGDIKKQQAAMKGISEAIGQIGDEKIRSKLISAGSDMEKLSSVIAELGEESRNQAKQISFFEDFRKAADKQSGWMERWFGWAGKQRKNISSENTEKFGKQLSSVLNLESLKDVNKMRSEVFSPDADMQSVKKSLVKGGMDKSKVDDLFQDAKDLEDVLEIISVALDTEAEQIKNTKFIAAMQRNTSAIKNYDAQLIRVANSLSSEFDSIIDYFEEISNISSSVFSERVELSERAGLSTKQQSREKLIKFQSEQIRSSQAMQTEKFVKNFLKEVKGEDFKGKESLESEYDKALGRYGKSGDDNKLIADVLKIGTRTDDKDINLKGLEKQTELEQKMVDGIRDLNNKSTIQIAALKLNNRLAEQNRILSGARQAAQMSTEDVMDFKKFGNLLKSKGKPSITSQDQVARSITTAESFLQSRNMEETPEFRKLAIEAQQSQILTSAARTLTAVPGLDFIDQDDPNFGFNNRDKMFEFFNLGNLKNAPTEGDNIVERREDFFNQVNSQQSEQKYLNERLFGTQQYQDYTADMSPENKRIFNETMKSALLGYRDIIVQQEKVRQEEGIKGYEEKETKKAMLDAFESSGLDAKKFFGAKDPEKIGMGEFNKSLAEALRESPLDVAMLGEQRQQTRLLDDIKGSLNKDLVNYQDALGSQEKIKEIRTKEQERGKELVTGIQKSKELSRGDRNIAPNYVKKSSLENIQSNLNRQITEAGGKPNSLQDYSISDTGIRKGEGLEDFQRYLQFKNKTASEVQVIEQSISNVENPQAQKLFQDQLKLVFAQYGNVLSNSGVSNEETPQKMVDLTKALNELSARIAKVNPVVATTAGQSMGYIPSFTSQTQIINELSKEPRYKDAINRERKASGSTPIIEHSKMLGMHAVYNKEQRAKYGSIDATIKRDHLAMGQDPNSLYITGSGNERYLNRSLGYVPSFNTLFNQEESEAKKLGAPSNVQAHYGKGTIDGKPFVMNNKEVEITASQMAQKTGLYPKKGDSAVLPNYKPEVKSQLNTKIQNAGGLNLDYGDLKFNVKKLNTDPSLFEMEEAMGISGIRGSLGHIPNFADTTEANLSVRQIQQKAFLESMTEAQREAYKNEKLAKLEKDKSAKNEFSKEYDFINKIINQEKAQKQKEFFEKKDSTQKIGFYRKKMDQFNLRIKEAKDKAAKNKIRQEKGKFHTEFINAADLKVATSYPYAESPKVKAKRLEQYLAPFSAEDPEKYLEEQAAKKYKETEYKNIYSKARSEFAPDKITIDPKNPNDSYYGEYEKVDTIPLHRGKENNSDEGVLSMVPGVFDMLVPPIYRNNAGNYLYRTNKAPNSWQLHSGGSHATVDAQFQDSISNQIDQKASENIKAKTKGIIDPRTVQVVKRVLEKAANPEKFAEWYATLSPEYREEMYKEMQNAQMVEKIPTQYRELMDKSNFGISYKKGDNAEYLQSIGSGLPEKQKQELIKKQAQRYDDLFKQDPNKFYAYWMRQTQEAREVVLKQLGSLERKDRPEYFDKLKQSGTKGIIDIKGPDAAKALDYKTLKGMGLRSPTRVQLWLQSGKTLKEAIALAEEGKAPAQTNQSRSTKAKNLSGWRENTRPRHLLKQDKTSYVKAGNHSNLSQRGISQDQNSNELMQKLEKGFSSSSEKENLDLAFGPIDGSLPFKSNKGYVPNFNEDQKSSTNKLFHSSLLSPIEMESKLASELGYEAGRVKQTDNFIYNDREKLISPEYINDNRIRGLGTPMSNTEGTLAVSSAIVPPTNTLAFEKYLPNFSKQLDMPITEVRSMLNPSYKNKNFAAGGAVPKVRSVPNFAPEQKPELGENAKQLDVNINNLPLLLEAAEQFDNTVEKLGQKIKDLSTVFSQGIKNSLDANVNVSGLDKSMEALKSEITKSIIDQIKNANNNGGQNSNQGSSIFGTPGEIWKNAPRGNTFGGNK